MTIIQLWQHSMSNQKVRPANNKTQRVNFMHVDAMLTMKKIDIAAIEAARRG